MLKMVTNEKQPKTLRGREVVEEAARLLRQKAVSPHRAAYLEGEHVSVLVAPYWNDDGETFRLGITCNAFGHRRVDWEGLPVFVESQSEDGVSWLCFLNTRGQAALPSLPPGDYRLSTSAQFGRSAQPIPFLNPALAALAARTSATDNTIPLPEPLVYQSTDGRLRATLRQTASDTTVVAVETNEASLAGAVVRFAFVQESGKIELSDTVTLQPVEGEEGLWEGRWEGAAQLAEPCEFVFEVITSP
jgi:hypothetical protein